MTLRKRLRSTRNDSTCWDSEKTMKTTSHTTRKRKSVDREKSLEMMKRSKKRMKSQ
jgi:hypothetical protein